MSIFPKPYLPDIFTSAVPGAKSREYHGGNQKKPAVITLITAG